MTVNWSSPFPFGEPGQTRNADDMGMPAPVTTPRILTQAETLDGLRLMVAREGTRAGRDVEIWRAAMHYIARLVEVASECDEAERRVARALDRIRDLANLDDPDPMVACISDVEELLKGKELI